MTDTASNAAPITAGPDPARAAEAFYDGGCPLCRAEIAAYRRMPWAARIRWLDADAGEGPPEIGAGQALARFHVRRADGTLVSGFRAFVALWRTNPRLAPWVRVLDRAPFVWAGEAGYRLFLLVRPLWRRQRG